MMRLLLGLVTIGLLATSSSVKAQEDPDAPPAFNLLDQLGPLSGPGGLGGGEELQLSAKYQIERGTRSGRLSVTAEMAPSWHVYSLTQPDGATQRSELKVAAFGQFELAGEFQPDVPPEIKNYEYFKVPVEEHHDAVTWTAPIRLAEGVAAENLQPQITFNGQVCQDDGACIPIQDRVVMASFAGYYQGAQTGAYRDESTHATWSGQLAPQVVTPGSTLQLTLTADLDSGWHVYAYEATDPDQIAKPTLIVVTAPEQWSASAVEASAEPVVEEVAGTTIRYHDAAVSWTASVQVPTDAKPGEYQLAGLVGFQTCTNVSCDLPRAARFSATVTVGPSAASGAVPLAFESAEYRTAAKFAAVSASATVGSAAPAAWADKPIVFVFAMAFLAGLALNVMPCVLPVIGLKVMSFVQQAGEHRLRVLSLNVWFSLGLLTVFWILATLPVALRLMGDEAFGWGEQFSYPPFSISLLAIVFVFGLSFLGVWEVPIPGLVGSSQAAHEMAGREGLGGAFAKGILATLLATPCTGPLLIPATGWAVAQPAWVTYLAFSCIGLGMAFPYLMIGAFPRLISLLPKPGAWMETFKQVMGFLLMGTAVWILSFLSQDYLVPTLALVVALAFACWLIGRLPITAPRRQKLWAWGMAIVTVVQVALYGYVESTLVRAVVVLLTGLELTGLIAVSVRPTWSVAHRVIAWGTAAVCVLIAAGTAWLHVQSVELEWQPYSRVTLQENLSEGRTVLVDFTADW